jgi:hypothetical protein
VNVAQRGSKPQNLNKKGIKMARQITFTNEALCRAVAKVAKIDGTKMDVVKELNLPDEKKGMNNVTQRMTALRKLGVNFPKLTKAKGNGIGRKITQETVAALNALLLPQE